MKKKFLLKDLLFNKEKVLFLTERVKHVYPELDEQAFKKKILHTFPELELKQRITWIQTCLREFLPHDYREAVTILLSSLPEELDPTKEDDDFGDYIFSPYAEFIARNGCNKKDLQVSLRALHEMTRRFSAEDGVRYFLKAYPNETLTVMKRWSRDRNYHVRRLVSEGTRPSLPWSQKLELDQKKTIALLDDLFYDETRYVVRSVANHMNDISKKDADLVIKTLKRWKRTGKQKNDEMDYLIRHALRTLVKRGNQDALALLGFVQDPQIQIKKFSIQKTSFSLGDSLNFQFDVCPQQDEYLMIDYRIHFPDSKGVKKPKVFKLKKVHVKKGDVVHCEKKHLLQNMSTKKLYSGEYMVQLQINGGSYGKLLFDVTA